jgi:hypothetical protein
MTVHHHHPVRPRLTDPRGTQQWILYPAARYVIVLDLLA